MNTVRGPLTVAGFAALALVAPLAAQEPFAGAVALDQAIEEAIRQDQIPGAVLLVSHNGQVVYRKAYGARSLTPRREAMTVDTIFDAASLTKVVATTPAVMKLFEEGKLRLNDRVTQYLPEFQGGTSEITVRQLLTHFSGLRPDLDLQPPWSGYETGIKLALIDKPVARPGERFAYSDINFILLGEIVRRLAGKPLAEYAWEVVFQPLGMTDTTFQPPLSLRPRIAPTELLAGDKATPARRGTRHHDALHGRRGRTCRSVHHRRRPGALCGHDAGARPARLGAPVQCAHGREIHLAAVAAGSTHSARPGMGHRFHVFGEPGRVVPARILRPHRLHRHIHVDRSHHANVRDPVNQQRAPPAPAGHHVPARPCGDHRRRRGRAGHARSGAHWL